MNQIPPKHETPDEPQTATGEKPPIRKSQEEYIDDMAGPSIDKSEYQPGKTPSARPATDADEPSRSDT